MRVPYFALLGELYLVDQCYVLVIWNEAMNMRSQNLIGVESMRGILLKTWKMKIKNYIRKCNWVELTQETEMREKKPRNVQSYLDRRVKYESKGKC